MTASNEINGNRYQPATGRGAARSAIQPRGIGVLADTCGGLFWGWARAEAKVIERLSRGVPEGVRPVYRTAA